MTDRTSAPKRYVAAELGLLAALSAGSIFDLLSSNWSQAALGFVNAGFFLFVITVFIGWRACAEDLFDWRAPRRVLEGAQSEARASQPVEKTVRER